jgi:ribonucleoside-diphosphate reductase alpha chain
VTLHRTEPDPQQAPPFNGSAAVEDAPLCAECGSMITRNGSCYQWELLGDERV